jgi:(E)-4-hydroxy-3-methyl-but-2-enyl pyrophosphate reductase
LKVIVSKNSGYCSGVKRAIKTLDDSIIKYSGKSAVFTMGDIIHNPKVIENYKNKGVSVINEIERLKKNDNLVIRSHGVSPEIIDKLSKKGVNILNATCTFVLKVHELAKELSKKGYFLILIGNENHPEIIGIKGNIIGENFKIINSVEEAENINSQKKIAVISQTTQTRENFILISKKIIEKIKNEVFVLNTTCKATELRQKEAALLSKKVDIMIVIGGKNSANTIHIAEISKKILPETYHIENADELNMEWFKGKKLAGICSGASTPMADVINIKNIIETI